MKITKEQLLRIAPAVGVNVGAYTASLNAAMERFEINTVLRAAHFLAQLSHESGDMTAFRENMNYGAAGLMRTWPTRFTTMADALHYERQPQKIANYVYAGRMGNGDSKSNDGWTYRGAGWFQLTGKTSQKDCAAFFKITADIGNWLCTAEGAAMSAAWFWKTRNLSPLADANNVDAVSDLINIGRRTEKVGDSIGYEKRLALTNLAIKVLL